MDLMIIASTDSDKRNVCDKQNLFLLTNFYEQMAISFHLHSCYSERCEETQFTADGTP